MVQRTKRLKIYIFPNTHGIGLCAKIMQEDAISLIGLDSEKIHIEKLLSF